MKNIILCGFMGCGKTTIGRLLARRLGMEYLDLDAVIEEQAGCPIPEIFARDGEAAFRELEHEAVAHLAKRIRCIVSTGGGALTYERNVKAISPEDRVVFLDASFEACYERIYRSERPLVRNNSKAELEALFAARRPLYMAAATLCADANGQPQAVTDFLVRTLNKKSSST